MSNNATGVVVAIGANAVRVRLANGRSVTCRNTLGARTPPGSTVIVVTTDAGGTDIVGRVR
ncbi:MAG: hypothetical protein H0U69_03375 [Trueperaceae bacterium]|nr:hypothetical protein [Trueperaceae bacterium]